MQGPRSPTHRAPSFPALLHPNAKPVASDHSPPPSPSLTPPHQDPSQPKEEAQDSSVTDAEWDKGARRRTLKVSARVRATLLRHAAFVGPGIIASVAYIDPGNWSTDLAAGSQFGYAHLAIVLLVGCLALVFQILSTRLGTVSGMDLSSHCRLALHDRPRHKMFYRWGLLYPLYVISECAIIFTDMAELLGSAIAINLLIPQIPLWACVLLTSADVFLILLLFNQYPTKVITRSMRLFELMIGLFVLAVMASFVTLLVRISPVWKDVFFGYVPGPGIIRGGGLYIAVGILGATCMPHAFFIGSKIATMRRLHPSKYEDNYESDSDDTPLDSSSPSPATFSRLPSPRTFAWSNGPRLHLPQPVSLGAFSLSSRRAPAPSPEATAEEGSPSTPARAPTPPEPKPSLACVRAHLGHAVADIAGSLLGFAVFINSSILILAAAVFYYGEGKSSNEDGVSDLFDAYDLVKQYIGPAFATLFAIALLAAGQAASLTVTLAGQIVSEGFIEWHTTPWKRRLVTRSIGIVPSLAVAIAIGREGISRLLVGSQVALSIALPFVIAPLVIFTSSQSIMSVPTTPLREGEQKEQAPAVLVEEVSSNRSAREWLRVLNPLRRRVARDGHESFTNGVGVIWFCCVVWTTITVANVFAIAQLGLGTA